MRCSWVIGQPAEVAAEVAARRCGAPASAWLSGCSVANIDGSIGATTDKQTAQQDEESEQQRRDDGRNRPHRDLHATEPVRQFLAAPARREVLIHLRPHAAEDLVEVALDLLQRRTGRSARCGACPGSPAPDRRAAVPAPDSWRAGPSWRGRVRQRTGRRRCARRRTG